VQPTPASFIIACDDDVFLLDGEGKAFESGVFGFEDGGVEAVVVLWQKLRCADEVLERTDVQSG
jgi:hypothetical protein